MEKIKQEVVQNKVMDRCGKCGKEVIGFTEKEVIFNMKRHEGSVACNEQQKRNKKVENQK